MVCLAPGKSSVIARNSTRYLVDPSEFYRYVFGNSEKVCHFFVSLQNSLIFTEVKDMIGAVILHQVLSNLKFQSWRKLVSKQTKLEQKPEWGKSPNQEGQDLISRSICIGFPLEKVPISTLRPIISGTSLPNPLKPDAK